VALHEGKVSKKQVREIGAQLARRREAGLYPLPKTGELAVRRGIMRRDEVDQILAAQDRLRGEGRVVPDLVERILSKGERTEVPLAGLLSGFVLGSGVVAWLADLDLAGIGTVLGIASALAAEIKAFFPAGLKGKVAPRALITGLPVAAIPLCFAYLMIVADKFVGLSGDSVLAASLFARIGWTVGLLALGVLLLIVVARWRHREVWYLRARKDLTPLLVSRAREGLAVDAAAPNAEIIVTDRIHEILSTTARDIGLQPFHRLLSWMARRLGRSVGGVTIWYMEPDASGFRVRTFAAPRAPRGARDALEEIQSHRPVFLDEAWFKRALERCTEGGRLDRRKFLANVDRSEHVSLTGYVFAKRRSVNGNTDECLVFDHAYAKDISPTQLDAETRRWLDFRSVAAYPVFSAHEQDGDPVGVITAFMCVKNGFTADDLTSLIVASELIGMFASPKVRDDNAEEGEQNAD